MSKDTRRATRAALAILTRQRPQPDEIDAIMASIPTRDARERKTARQQQQKEEAHGGHHDR